MEYYNNILAVPAMWLIENDIITESQYRHMSYRKQFNIIRTGGRGRTALVSYDSIPDRLKTAIKKALGCDPYEAARTSQVEMRIEHNAELSDNFENYKLDDGRNLPKKNREEYYYNAIVLEAIDKLVSDKVSYRKARNGSTRVKWNEVAQGVEDLDRTKYPHSLPTNERRLRERLNLYKKEGWQSLIHKNYMNINAAKVDDEIKESYLIEFIGNPRNFDNAQIAKLYNMIAEQMGWKKITASTVAIYRDKHFMTTYAGRRGTSEHNNKLSMQVKRSAPSAPLYFWTLDGWDVELMYQSRDKDGYATYGHRPTIVVVLDPCLKYPIGYAVGDKETPNLIMAALRNAAHHTAELFGTMHRAHQIQSDRYSIKKMTPYYGVIGEKVTPAKARNAKSKVIEPWFRYLNKKWCQMMGNWSGQGITSNPEKQPNAEFLNKTRHSQPDFEGVCNQVSMIIERERDEIRDRYLELWNNLDDANKIELSRESYLLQFGETTGHKILMKPHGLNPTIKGIERAYDCFDLTFRDHLSTRWTVKYDPNDLSIALAVNDDESLRYVLEEKHIQPMALKDREVGDSEQLQRVREFNKVQENEIIERRANSGNIVERHFNGTKLIENEVLAKLLITDSRGQHKDVKNKNRNKAINKANIQDAVEVVEMAEEMGERDYLSKY